MTIGLLQCDHVADEFFGIAGDYDEMFRKWLPADWRVYDLTAGQFPAPDACDAWVATGSRESVYDEIPWVHRFADLVRQIHAADVPFLGVCFGHQMMGHALGGKVSKSERGWGVGVHEFRICAREPWMSPSLDTVSLLMSCQDQVDVVPPGSVVLASNAHCPVAIFRCGRMLGIQGHPEWEPEYAAALLKRRRDRIGAERSDAALASLTRPRNSVELSGWARQWLAGLG
jgi:GMP synthase-like glutamine amidotransferase